MKFPSSSKLLGKLIASASPKSSSKGGRKKGGK